MPRPTIPEDLYILPRYYCQNCQDDFPVTHLFWHTLTDVDFSTWMCVPCGEEHVHCERGLSLMDVLKREHAISSPTIADDKRTIYYALMSARLEITRLHHALAGAGGAGQGTAGPSRRKRQEIGPPISRTEKERSQP